MLCVGLGAVATTFIAGVENIRRGAAKPIGSLTQMGTIRLGKRTESRAPLIKDFVPLADARRPRLRRLGSDARQRLRRGAQGGRARPARARRADRATSSRPSSRCRPSSTRTTSSGSRAPTSRPGKTKRELAEALRQDIRDFKAKHGCDRLVMVWCASTEIFISPGPAHWTLEAFEKAMDANDPIDRAVDALRLGRDHGGRALRQRRAQPDLRLPGDGAAGQGPRASPSAARTSRPARPW